jgi:hypothetical protein
VYGATVSDGKFKVITVRSGRRFLRRKQNGGAPCRTRTRPFRLRHRYHYPRPISTIGGHKLGVSRCSDVGRTQTRCRSTQLVRWRSGVRWIGTGQRSSHHPPGHRLPHAWQIDLGRCEALQGQDEYGSSDEATDRHFTFKAIVTRPPSMPTTAAPSLWRARGGIETRGAHRQGASGQSPPEHGAVPLGSAGNASEGVALLHAFGTALPSTCTTK